MIRLRCWSSLATGSCGRPAEFASLLALLVGILLELRERAKMRISTPFDPIEVGETDVFAFDFTPDVGTATIVSTSWTCVLGPYETALDAAPQSRILSIWAPTALQLRSPLDGSLQMRTGAFSVGLIGGVPISAAGATYILEATANLSDGRVLKLNSTVQCKLPGQ